MGRERASCAAISDIGEQCIDCGICVKECAFLQAHGSPLTLATLWQTADGDKEERLPFECSLCGLCHGVCPKKLDPSAMFLAMRRELVARGRGNFPQHRTIRAYERQGSSSLLSWYSLPDGCDTVFFPGCALPGSRPRTLTRLFKTLGELIPDIGMVFDCCHKPSHDLGDVLHFQKMFTELCATLDQRSIRKVLVACPNCYRVFREYGASLEVETVYEVLARSAVFSGRTRAEVTVHDPCGVRFSAEVQESARSLLLQQGLTIQEMKHSRQTGFCCGEGGSAGFLRPDFAGKWTEKRLTEAAGEQIVSYCAGCTHFLGKDGHTSHLLDLLYEPEPVLAGRARVSRAPFTYWNRYRLKKRLQKEQQGGLSGTREQLRPPSSP